MTQSLGGKTVNMKQLNTALCMTQNCDKWQWIKWLSVSHCEKQIPIKDFKQSLIRNESDKIRFKNFIIIKEQETILFFICILPDYVSHESSKEFWKNSHFENMNTLGGVKTHFGKLALNLYSFRHEKNDSTNIMSLLLIQLEFKHTKQLKMILWKILMWLAKKNGQKWLYNSHLWVINFQGFFYIIAKKLEANKDFSCHSF